jgi:hypothetical protein
MSFGYSTQPVVYEVLWLKRKKPEGFISYGKEGPEMMDHQNYIALLIFVNDIQAVLHPIKKR